MTTTAAASSVTPFIPPRPPSSTAYGRVQVEVWQERADAPEISPGDFVEVSDRLACDRVQRRIDSTIDRAELHYRFSESSPPMVSPGGAFQRDYLAQALADIDPNRLIRVVLASGLRNSTIPLIVGYPALDTMSWSRSPADHAEGVTFQVLGVMDRWDHDFCAQVVGRWVHGSFPIAGDPDLSIDGSIGNLREVQSVPCAFNENGLPNCSPFPIELQLNLGGEGPVDVPLYVFASPGEKVQFSDPNNSRPVEYWSHARALWYLIYLYGARQYDLANQNRPIELPLTWISKMVTDDILQAEPLPTPFGTAFVKAMLGRPTLETNNTSLLDAISMVCADAGCHFHVDYGRVFRRGASASVTPRLVVWMDGVDLAMNEPPAVFTLARGVPRDPPASRPAARMRANRAMQASLTQDGEPAVNAPIIVGGRRLYEAGFDLLPGWRPLLNLDNVPTTGAEAAKDAWRSLGSDSTENPGAKAIYKRSDEKHDSVRDIGRKWALNETGTYFGRTGVSPDVFDFARSVEPQGGVFGVSAYVPFDPTSVDLRAWDFDPVNPAGPPDFFVIGPTDWALRPRPFGNSVRPQPALHEEAPVCDISFDSGLTFQTETRLEVLATEAAVRFNADSPLDITPLDPITKRPKPWWDDNMWFAIIEARFRVRLTATIEGDELVIPRWRSLVRASASRISRLRTQIIDRPEYAVVSRHGSKFLPTGVNRDTVRKDLIAADAFREELAQTFADRQISASVTEPYIDIEPHIGQAVDSVSGISVVLARQLGQKLRDPQIVGLDYQLSEAQSTTIHVGDLRKVREPQLEQS